jgi:hypothetical protein
MLLNLFQLHVHVLYVINPLSHNCLTTRTWSCSILYKKILPQYGIKKVHFRCDGEGCFFGNEVKGSWPGRNKRYLITSRRYMIQGSCWYVCTCTFLQEWCRQRTLPYSTRPPNFKFSTKRVTKKFNYHFFYPWCFFKASSKPFNYISVSFIFVFCTSSSSIKPFFSSSA